MSRLAVVLFNLGGPDGPDAVRPFLFNLFKDPAIIGAPAPVRYPLAAFISTTRAKGARANYAMMGGGSPLLPETRAQAEALEAELARTLPGQESRVFIAMRYWKPFAAETAREVAAFGPDEIVLLPLYPQFSTTTTESSLRDWARAYRGPGRSRTVCCYPISSGLAEAHARAIRGVWEAAGRPTGVRLLFSAHGLPEKVIKDGDPYQAQVEATASAVARLLPEFTDWGISYQSRVGPLKWIGPSTDDEIRRAGAEGVGVLVSPIAFVSEHVETLVELDHEYAELAKEAGCPVWLRAPAPGIDPAFISALGGAVTNALGREGGTAADGGWTCPAAHGRCPCLDARSGGRR
ncbi:ferrochelatase [Phenylobacterium parvum]|uniref:Ferrochelatase n=1 Tax=Phenylobacterium parvum TaxID=2201350 RepID=A0A2Z3HZS4_9CAUL|nr:ferrochelatase [Phenylobacterium parvum]AWM78570.1 ferrochelatase [Phenylobacterium parvum]